jgi:hypothetical protein
MQTQSIRKKTFGLQSLQYYIHEFLRFEALGSRTMQEDIGHDSGTMSKERENKTKRHDAAAIRNQGHYYWTAHPAIAK